MSRRLKYFMWGYQEHFCRGMEFRASNALKELGVSLPFKPLLVGIRAPEVAEGYQVCIVPEDGEFDPNQFQSCYSRYKEIEMDHPDQNLFYGDEPSMRDKPIKILRKSIRQAVEEMLTKEISKDEMVVFCGSSVRVSDYYVVPVLLVCKDTLCELPRMKNVLADADFGCSSSPSLVDSLIYILLNEASEGLEKKEPGRYILSDNQCSITELLKQAAISFCSVIPLSVGDYMLQGVFGSLNKISSLRYEGEASRGSIVFAAQESKALDYKVKFIKPTSLNTYQLVRKLIEVTDENLSCVCDSENGISGLATVAEGREEQLFRAVFTGHYCWSLVCGTTVLMECAFGIPKTPKVRLTRSLFHSNIRRVLKGMTQDQADTLWKAVLAAMKQKHGTMLVISDDAHGEAKRLKSQSISVVTVKFTPELVSNISNIDGAIMLDRECSCHAVGVILDGMASEDGDSSRGARYNSAIKYISSIDAPTLCLVVSEDGYVDMIPELKPQIDRVEIDGYLEALKGVTSENYHKTRSWLDRHRFYLNAEQCDVANTEFSRIESECRRSGAMWIVTNDFLPDVKMDDSYYKDTTLN